MRFPYAAQESEEAGSRGQPWWQVADAGEAKDVLVKTKLCDRLLGTNQTTTEISWQQRQQDKAKDDEKQRETAGNSSERPLATESGQLADKKQQNGSKRQRSGNHYRACCSSGFSTSTPCSEDEPLRSERNFFDETFPSPSALRAAKTRESDSFKGLTATS